MRIGIFTDTYFPQVSGVATSIKVLKEQLEKLGHQVYIFTSTDPNVDKHKKERNIFRFASLPFIFFKDRRLAVRGEFKALRIAKKLNLDIIHTQTEFSMGMMGKFVAKHMHIPCVHTYHTMYEDYLHYVADGKLLKPKQVAQLTRMFLHHVTAVVAPSERVLSTLKNYGIKNAIKVIPTGVNVNHYKENDLSIKGEVRSNLNIDKDIPVLVTVSRLALEKNINFLIDNLPKLLNRNSNIKLVIVGDGPAKQELQAQVEDLHLKENVIFTGEIKHTEVYKYYQMADVLVSASDSESQGLTYIEAVAAHIPIVVKDSPYVRSLLNYSNVGEAFINVDEFVEDVFKCLQNKLDYTDSKKLLREISADTFGQRIVEFYKFAYQEYINRRLSNGTRKRKFK